jgi:hypothetical protein
MLRQLLQFELLRPESLWVWVWFLQLGLEPVRLEQLWVRAAVNDHQLRLSDESCSCKGVNELLLFPLLVAVLSVTA